MAKNKNIVIVRTNGHIMVKFKNKTYHKDFKNEADSALLEITEVLESGFIDKQFLKSMFKKEVIGYQPKQTDKTFVSHKKVNDLVRAFPEQCSKASDGSIRVANIDIPVPYHIVNNMHDRYLTDKDISSHVNFWLNVLQCPNTTVREGIYEWLEANDFIISPQGFIVAFRNVDIKKDVDEEWSRKIVNTYMDLKASNANIDDWEAVWAIDSAGTAYNFISNKKSSTCYLGNNISLKRIPLKEAFLNLDTYSDTIYTDHHSGKTTIMIGSEVRIPRSACDETNATCSRGLHNASAKFLSKGYYGSGATLVTLIHPKDVVALPGDYKAGKFRSCAYTPIDYAEWIDDDTINLEAVKKRLPYYEIKMVKEAMAEIREKLDAEGIDPSTIWETYKDTDSAEALNLCKIYNDYKSSLEVMKAQLNSRIIKI
jgi:hypothetical protein